MNVPDVPATEFLPLRQVPATISSYAGEDAYALNSDGQGAPPEEKAKRADPKTSAAPNTEAVVAKR